MLARRLGRISALGLVTLVPLLFAGTASAGGGPLTHIGNPQRWGPAAVALCDDPRAAHDAGYVVVVLDNGDNVYTGTAASEAIYALGGSDTIEGGGGNDLLCLGQGSDVGHGGAGNDAVFGGGENDRIKGGPGRDYLAGGAQYDACAGKFADDTFEDCEVIIRTR